jgi:MFS transporter, FSR family, fosmidomycin resistance protein
MTPSNASAAASGSPATSLRDDASVIALVGSAHLISHFSQLLLAPLFPWLKDAFSVSYTELGLLMTLFFVVSCGVQAASGFVVDHFGPRPVLFGGLGLLGLAAFGYALSTSYAMLAVCAVLSGVGNGVFHPVNYTLLNRKISAPRLGHAYSAHGITGSLGWALAPAWLVSMAFAFSWRVALASAGVLILSVLAVLVWHRAKLTLPALGAAGIEPPTDARASSEPASGVFDFVRIPAIWMCLFFLTLYGIVLSAVQAFAPEAARQLHGVPVGLVALCLSAYMLCSAAGMVLGGFLAAQPARAEAIVALGLLLAAATALALGLVSLPGALVPVLFGVMGFGSGIGAPSRDLIIKRATPVKSSGRVYGLVYSGFDIGQAAAPLAFGMLIDRQRFVGVFIALALVQLMLIATVFRVKRVRRFMASGVPA